MPQRPDERGSARRFLPEVQALRALAVTLVVLFHLWPDRLRGGYVGVDVFFVISGFLISAHLLREIQSTGSLKLREFWARRIRRLLPASLTVVAVSLVAVLLFLPQTVWQRTVVEIGASSVYVLNWVLANSAVDYFAADNAATAVQHYWSLSVEEQFYVVWPLLLLAVAVIALRRKRALRPALAITIAVVVVLSLGYSIWYTNAVPAAAYFSTFTHAWEFGIGALVAIGAHRFDAARWMSAVRLRSVASVLGFVAIVGSAVFFTGATPFPGYTALLPVLGTALVIIAGDTRGTRLSPMPLLSLRPVQFLGNVSYSAYLWHWPPIVILPFILGHALTTPWKIAILVGTLVMAWLTKKFIEDRARTAPGFARRPRNSFVLAAVAALVLVAGCVAPWTYVQVKTDAALADARGLLADAVTGDAPCFGAAAALSGTACDNLHLADPNLVLATQITKEDTFAGGRKINIGGALDVTEYGPKNAKKTIALIGDSHAGHYLPAVRAIAQRHGWRVWELRAPSCTPSAPTWVSHIGGDMLPGCQAWRHDLLNLLPKNNEIDEIVTSSVSPRYARTETPETQTMVADAFVQTWTAWSESGKDVVVIADDPGPGASVGEAGDCVASHVSETDPCTSPRGEVLEKDAMVVAAQRAPIPGVKLLDFTPVYCGTATCHTVVGGIVVYGGGAHIARLFALSLTPYIEPAILENLHS